MDCDRIQDENKNIQNNENDYKNLFQRLNNIESIMADIQKHLKKDN